VRKLHSRILSFNVFLIAGGFVACWGILIWAMGRGYDFTDDSYYLIWASAPWRYDWSVSEFGFLWHPIYELVRGDIRLFRIAGAVLLSGSGALFGWSIWRFMSPVAPRSVAPAVILAMAAASFWNLIYWIPTPGYNELNLIGLLLLMAGLIFAIHVIALRELMLCAAIAAMGLALTAFAKPTTALFALILGVLWLVLLRPKRPVAFTALAGAFGLIFLFAGIWAIDGSIQAFVQRQFGGLRVLQMLSPSHGIAQLYRSAVDPAAGVVLNAGHRRLAIFILAVGLVWSMLLLLLSDRYAAFKLVLNALAAAYLGYLLSEWRSSVLFGSYYDIASISPLLLVLSLAGALCIKRPARDDAHWCRALMLTILSLGAASCFSIGTNNRMLYHESFAAVFWFAALILLAAAAVESRRATLVSGAALLASFMTAGLLIGAMRNPYRLSAAISQQTEPVVIGPRAASLLVDRTTADYIKTLQAAARTHGFQAGLPILDLTGASPGAVFALGGIAPGRGWLNGGYPGSADAARESLKRVPVSDLSRAWVLTVAGNSPDKLPDTVLQSLGVNFPANYEAVGQACKGNPCITDILWKPVR
jgi:hypothetical protein